MKFKKPIIYISIPAFIWLLYFLFVKTDLFIPRQKEIAWSEQLQTKIIKQIAEKFSFKDTLYIATTRLSGVCGNDERYDGSNTLTEQIERIKYVKANPYFIDVSKVAGNIYTFGNKVMITGEAFDATFTSGSIHFNNDTLNPKRTVYDLVFRTREKDRLVVAIADYENGNTEKWQATFISKNGDWVLE